MGWSSPVLRGERMRKGTGEGWSGRAGMRDQVVQQPEPPGLFGGGSGKVLE